MHVDGGDRVVAYFAGHAHQGGYMIDTHGIHHRTLESPLECAPGVVAFGTVDVYDSANSGAALVLRCGNVAPPMLVMRAADGSARDT
jgi:hypothetical protein